MSSGFWDLWEPLFMDLNIPNYFKNIKKWINLVKHYFCNSQNDRTSRVLRMWERVGSQITLFCGGVKQGGFVMGLNKNGKQHCEILIKSLEP